MFRKLDDRVSASPQIGLDDVSAAAGQGVRLIINNRPEGESDDRPKNQRLAHEKPAGQVPYQTVAGAKTLVLEFEPLAFSCYHLYLSDFWHHLRLNQPNH